MRVINFEIRSKNEKLQGLYVQKNFNKLCFISQLLLNLRECVLDKVEVYGGIQQQRITCVLN